MDHDPLFSVITTVRNGERSLPALADALDAQTIGRERFEWVVIDNASRDQTAATAAARGAIVVAEPVPGRARARNRGVAASRAPFLAFTDADCRPQHDWLEQLGRGLGDGAALVAGLVRMTTGDPPTVTERFDALWRFRDEETVEQRGWAATANLAMRRDAFDEISGFDESFRHIGEDVDLCLRARAAGHRLRWWPDAVVDHPAEVELRHVLRRSFEQAYALADLHRKHGLSPGRYWRHPGPLVRGDWAVRRFGIEPGEVPEGQRRRLLWVARAEYGGRIVGSLWAAARRRAART